MKKTKIIIAVTTLGLVGAQLVGAQSINYVSSSTPSSFTQQIIQHLTDSQKSVLEQARNLFNQGKKDEAKTLLEQNGFTPKKIVHGTMKKGPHKIELENAIINSNYSTFQTLASTSPLKSINESTFNQLKTQFTARKNAQDNIKTILQAAGVEVQDKRPGKKQANST